MTKLGKRARTQEVIESEFIPDNEADLTMSSEITMPKDDEELVLEEMLFGDMNALASLDSKTDVGEELPVLDFFIDTHDSQTPQTETTEIEKSQAAWVDSDDEKEVSITAAKRLRKLRTSYDETHVQIDEYEKRLRSQFEKVHPTPSWAVVREQSKDLLSILKSTDSIVESNKTLMPGKLGVFRLKDANTTSYSKATINSVRFHPSAPLCFTAGMDKMLKFFEVDGKTNAKVTSVRFGDLPISCAEFIQNGSEVIVSGKRPFFYTFNLLTSETKKIHGIRGRDEHSFDRFKVSPDTMMIAFLCHNGIICLLSATTKQKIAELKMNGPAIDLAFSKDGKTLFSIGTESEVYVWDIASRMCVARFADDGCIKATTIAISPNSCYLATGSQSGVVNLYDISKYTSNWKCFPSQGIKPIHAFMNLTTLISSLVFNHDSQLLAIASHNIKDALRIIHTGDCSVMQNWPTQETPLGYVSSVVFSPKSETLAIGNAKGKVILYQLNAYT